MNKNEGFREVITKVLKSYLGKDRHYFRITFHPVDLNRGGAESLLLSTPASPGHCLLPLQGRSTFEERRKRHFCFVKALLVIMIVTVVG